MWILLILFAGLLLSTAVFLLARRLLGPPFTFLVLIGRVISRRRFFVLSILLAIYYSRGKSN